MSTAAPARLVCPECRRENEPERIYCHDCGTRLDRSALASIAAAEKESPDEVHKRLSGMFDSRRGRLRPVIMRCVKLLLAAVAAAAVVLMLLPPPVLPPVTKSETLPPQISLDLEGMTQYHRPPQLHYSEADVNAYLAYVLSRKKEMLEHLLLGFERVTAAFHPASCDVAVARSIFGCTIYTSGIFSVKLQSGRLNGTPSAGAIGRLPIHPQLMRSASFLFGDLLRALERERKLIARCGSVELRDKEIVFTAP